ncbi:MAG: crotonase/enoyl-CoA hydratase family protein [Deltaproteobacteria bacterium]|nr:crotonase/enoyl-CoA hydratase family protein [Deltaproteobacteria bacterium]
MSSLVTTEIENHVAHVRLNRPEKYNALSPDMCNAIIDAGRKVAADKSVRAVVLSGEGKGFCAGLDFQSFMEMEKLSGENEMALFDKPEGSAANYAQLVGYIWKQVPVPVIAAVHGVAFGGGLQLALAADIRLVAGDAKFSIMEIKWGLIPDMSGTQTLRDLVRLDVAKELTYTGRVVQAEEAAALGLVTRVCDDPLAAAREMAAEIAGKSPDAIVAGKKLLDDAWHGSSSEGLELEARLQKGVIGRANQVEAVMANFEKRAPNFANRER